MTDKPIIEDESELPEPDGDDSQVDPEPGDPEPVKDDE